jgi:protein TonB
LVGILPIKAQSDKKLIKDVFDNYNKAISNGNWTDAANYLDGKTKRFYGSLLDKVKSADPVFLQRQPTLHRLIVFATRLSATKEEILSFDQSSYMAYCGKIGLTQAKFIKDCSLGKIYVSNDYASGELKNMDKTDSYPVYFHNDKGSWRLDLMSSLSTKVLGLGDYDDIKNMGEDVYLIWALNKLGIKAAGLEMWWPTIRPEPPIANKKYYYDIDNENSDSSNAVCYKMYTINDSTEYTGIISSYNMDGVMISETHYSNYYVKIREGISKEFHENGALKSVENYSNDLWDGEIITYYDTGIMRRKDYFTKGEFIRGKCFTASGQDTTHFDYLQEPKYEGGNEALYKALGTIIKYPAIARENGIQGNVILSFVVDKQGRIKEKEVLQSAHPSLDEEALRALTLLDKWIPAKLDGDPIRCRFKLPVKFKLE